MTELPYSFSQLLRLVLKSLASSRKAHAPGSRVMLPEDPIILHRAFFDIPDAIRHEFPPLEELHFITAGAYPYSPELTEALDSLQMSGAITRENPSYERFSVTEYDDTSAIVEALRREITGGIQERQAALARLIDHLDQKLERV